MKLVRHITLVLVAALAAVGCSEKPTERAPRANPSGKNLVILGIDGMDYQLTRRYMREGKLPNLKKLADKGHFRKLRTTKPPQSPVAWSTFLTGVGPAGHGIYDFVHRDPKDISPYLSTSKAEQPDCTIKVGDMRLPYCSAEVKSLRRGVVFWELLEERGIPATVYKVPANFPPHEHWHTETVSGMGTPDLMGTYGTFQLLTEDRELAGEKFSGGVMHAITFDGERHAEAVLHGPPNVYHKDAPAMELEVDIVVDRARKVALVELSGQKVMLELDEITDWIPIAFEAPMFMGSVPGMVRLMLKSVDPVAIYVSPINLDPTDPVMPISSPREFSAQLADKAGRYYTQGMPEDTKALGHELLSDDEFLVQAEAVYEERMRLLDNALESYDGGLMFFYFSSLDQLCHVFWRSLDVPEDHELHEHADVIPDIYERMDAAVGMVMERLPEGTELIILSDHGFAPFHSKVHLNTWLYQKGYLALREDGSRGPGPLGHIDWSRTQAYALGLNQLFINQVGREPEGAVPVEEREALKRRLIRDLEQMRDPSTGRRVVRRVFEFDTAANPERAPDLMVGYDRGYRSSDSSAMGKIGDKVIEPNEEKWSGDHCMDPAVVPGVLFSTMPLTEDHKHHLADMTPTILDYFELPAPEGLEGKSVLANGGGGGDQEQAKKETE